MFTIEESRRRWEQRDTSHGFTARLGAADASDSRAAFVSDGLAPYFEYNEAQAIAQKENFRDWYEKALAAAQAHRQAGKARAPRERIRSG